MSSTPPSGTGPRRSVQLALAGLTLVLIVFAALWLRGRPHATSPTAAATRPTTESTSGFVGSTACAACHAEAYRRWQGSQHAVAMQAANDKTVLGDFGDARFEQFGVTTEFFRRDNKFLIRTEGPDGRPGEFQVRQVFGVYPLQQYLVELAGGHVQAFSIAWDARPAGDGGQRWFHLYPNERIDPRDELHWTRRQQNWNYMCADCHSTNVQKNYDAASNTYRTQWSEISVGCEACHGPGSRHVRLAEAARKSGARLAQSGLTATLDERRGVVWRIDPTTGNATRSVPRPGDRDIDVCAQCHARRGQFSNGYHAGEPFTDHYTPALLTADLYYPDGQQRDEDYNWGSFLSSRMYSKGVTCSDCHEPHGGKLRTPGNQVCAQCHLASKYDVPSHHFHQAGQAGTACADCHMRTETYMVVDPRHDHSFRIPRPDLTVSIGTPNACNQCHRDRSPQWAAAEVKKRYPQPKPGFQDFAEAFAASDHGQPVTMELTQVVANDQESAIARASALTRLALWPSENTLLAAEAALKDPSPLVRMAALDAYETLPPLQRKPVAPLLTDPSRAVRIQAARVLAPVAADALGAQAAAAFAKAADEYLAAERYNADRPENRTNLGGYFTDRGEYPQAEAEFRAATVLDDRFVPAWVNLADLMRLQNREPDAERALRSGLAVAPDDATLHHALGLSLVRQKKMPAALDELKRAAELAPGNIRLTYVYAIALHSTGRTREALTWLQRALVRAPNDRDVLSALMTMNAQSGNAQAASEYGARLQRLYPTGEASGGVEPSGSR
ncbi:MAG TPA: tetratricopeptide repeat protein [Steroidobacteraceae bacterium]